MSIGLWLAMYIRDSMRNKKHIISMLCFITRPDATWEREGGSLTFRQYSLGVRAYGGRRTDDMSLRYAGLRWPFVDLSLSLSQAFCYKPPAHPPIIRCWPTGQPIGQWVGLGDPLAKNHPRPVLRLHPHFLGIIFVTNHIYYVY